MRLIKLLPTIAVALLAGCATNAVEADYGRSVHEMLENQSARPIDRASVAATVQGANPDMINAAVKGVQTEVSKGSDIRGTSNASAVTTPVAQ